MLRLLTALAVATLPPAMLAHLLGAEGPRLLLAAWSASVVLLSMAAFAFRSDSSIRRRISRAAILLALLVGGAGLIVALVQLNVARRSLAEAWLELARIGEAFGFFSFFAAELYALFCMGSALLFLARRPASALAAAAASTAFTVGVIWGDWRALTLAIVSAVSVPIFSVRLRAGERRMSHLRSASPPALAALIAALPFAIFVRIGSSGPLMRPVDLTAIVRTVFPSFPLLLDVPGYGFEIGASSLAPSVYLSDGVLFAAESDGPGLRYIVSAVYSDWIEGTWRASEAPGAIVSVERRAAGSPRPAGALRLRLAEDFYSIIPVERGTKTVFLSEGNPKTEKATLNKGVRFAGIARRGLIADLEGGPDGATRIVAEGDDGPGGRWVNPGADVSDRLSSLAKELAARGEKSAAVSGEERDRAVLQTILDHFKTGYAYALKGNGERNGEVAIDRFLFEDRKGYCLHYATAFTLLARHAGISARIVEGFRVSLEETGHGSVKGVDAHAWVEAWVDGAWRTFEPTPPFASSDPFAYLDGKDASARRQFEILFGRPEQAEKREDDATWVSAHRELYFAVALAILIVILFTTVRHMGRPHESADVREVKRRAVRLVSCSKACGIAGPEILGWTGWARAVRFYLEAQAVREGRQRVRQSRKLAELDGAKEAADLMLRIVFDEDSRER